MMKIGILVLILVHTIVSVLGCDPCYKEIFNQNCPATDDNLPAYTLHMSVHPHLDAFWIFNFSSYYDPKPGQSDVKSYFMSNRFNSVKQIFKSATEVLWNSKKQRQSGAKSTQKAHRSFFNSQMGFFKKWYTQQSQGQKEKVQKLLKTKYWEILGGGFVEHDEGCAYYDDMIENFQLGLNFLKKEFNYHPKASVAADSFGHSQTTLAMLAHMGIEGYFVERSDEHMLLQNKTQFIWKAKSSNGKFYGAMPTHVRWAIHGFQDQFIGGRGSDPNEKLCASKEPYINNLRNENKFLKRILKSSHIMRYFGHDFQRFDDYSYRVIEGMMERFSMEKCGKVVATYGNPTEYFITLMDEVYGKKIKPIHTRTQDIFPIWDYDSGLYWTGYYTTDPYHKKNYRDLGRFLHAIRKFYLPFMIDEKDGLKNKNHYQTLEKMAEQVAYLQHHDGISGTSKYAIMDELQKTNEALMKDSKPILKDLFEDQFPLGTNNVIFECHIGNDCVIPSDNQGDVYLKIFNSGANPQVGPIVVQMPINHFYEPDCEYEVMCFCQQVKCPCKLYLYKSIYTYTAIRLQKTNSFKNPVNRLISFRSNPQYQFNLTHFNIHLNSKRYSVGYKKVLAEPTSRNYSHLSRYGVQGHRGFQIRSGKYALGNNPNKISDFSTIREVFVLKSEKMTIFLIKWKRQQMKTLISISNTKKNEIKVDTLSSAQSYHLQDLYFEVETPINNKNKFTTDSNGWLTLERQLFKHEDYQAFFSKDKYDDIDGNSYPVTAFAYIKDQTDKVSVNVDRPQGCIAYRTGALWLNFDRLSTDDGKWVYESQYKSEYQKFTHIITIQNKDYNQRHIQKLYDQPLLIQGNGIAANQRVQDIDIDSVVRSQWNKVSNINDIKFLLRPYNDSTTILRIHNLHDLQQTTVGLFAEKNSPFLTTYYGRTVSFESIQQYSLGGNMNYTTFLNQKFNWHQVINLTEENQIFNKIFRQNVTLRPLEIRTFMIKNINFNEKCIEVNELSYDKKLIEYTINTKKAGPTRQKLTVELQNKAIHYMLQEDHCNGNSPIVQSVNLDSNPQDPNYHQPKGGDTFSSKPMDSPSHIPTPIQPPVHIQKPRIPLKPINRSEKEQNTFKDIEIKIEKVQRLTPQEKLLYFICYERYFSDKYEIVTKLAGFKLEE